MKTRSTQVPLKDRLQENKLFFIQYRGSNTDWMLQKLKKIIAPIIPILTMRKLKTVLSPLKATISKSLSSNIINKTKYSGCEACYVGYTTRHLKTRLSEHRSSKSTVKEHTKSCKNELGTIETTEILHKSHKGQIFLSILEALYIRDINPSLNTRDEFRGRSLRIRI